MKTPQFITNQLNHSNHLSRQAPSNCSLLQLLRRTDCHAQRRRSFGPGRGQGITTHSIPRGGRSGDRRLAKGSQHFVRTPLQELSRCAG